MNINRTTLLAGVATLALTVGTGFALAQEQQKGPAATHPDQPHAAAPANSHAAPPMNNKGSGMQPEGANHNAPTPGPAAQQTPKENERAGQSGAQPGAEPNGQHAQGVNRGNKSNNEGTTAQEKRIPPGLQGNASAQTRGQRQLSEQQRTQIRQTLIDPRGARRVGHVDFDLRVGTQIPRGQIDLIEVPDTLVQIDSEWQGFLYFVYEDEIVVVDPNDMEIVAVLPV
jgi:Protein of unknown function (DUF1236)